MLDYVGLEDDLDEEERLIRDTAREFVEEQVNPDIGEHFEAGTFPEELITEMGDLGFYAPNLDGYGLAGVSETAYGLLMQELEAGDSGIRSMASVQGALVMYPIFAYGSEEQKERWLPDLGTGEKVGCFGLTEPEHGSNPSAMETRAERDGDEYVFGFGEAETTHFLAGPEIREPAFFLLLGAVGVDRIHHERALDARHRADPRVTRLQLLH